MYERFGDESVLSVREIAEPAPAAGHVKVKVRVASLNPVDFKLRSGILRMVGRPKRPAITGKDFAGEITAIARDVHGYALGQRVFGSVDPMAGSGSCAEFVSISTDLIAPIPDSVSDEVAACLPVASGTALQVLTDIAHLRQGQSILITGASGSVGASAVQLARSIGACITGETISLSQVAAAQRRMQLGQVHGKVCVRV
jgi:NADPH:quinone reductase-like Zn-dependent oxidoreductase